MRIEEEFKPKKITFETFDEFTRFVLLMDYISCDPDQCDDFRGIAKEISDLITRKGEEDGRD